MPHHVVLSPLPGGQHQAPAAGRGGFPRQASAMTCAETMRLTAMAVIVLAVVIRIFAPDPPPWQHEDYEMWQDDEMWDPPRRQGANTWDSDTDIFN